MRHGRGGGAAGAVQGTATFVFTDLVGSTELIERLGDDVSDPLIREHLGRLGEVVAAFDGRVVKSLGDGLMAAFQSTAKAVAAAVTMQQVVEQMNRDSSDRLGLRVGVHAGETTFDGTDYYGKPVWVARRFCERARGGEILCSEVVKDLGGGRGGHRFTGLGEVELRGVTAPLEAFAIEWDPAPGAIELALPRKPGLTRWLLAGGALAVLVSAAVAWQLARDEATQPPRPRSTPRSTPRPADVSVSLFGRLDLRPSQLPGEDDALDPSISADGRVVVFETRSRLSADDRDDLSDIYWVEPPGAARRVASSPDGDSFAPVVSDDGRFIAFESDATNLVPNDLNGHRDVFRFDVREGDIVRASERKSGLGGKGDSFHAAISGDGRFVAFASDAPNLTRSTIVPDTNGERDVFVYDAEQDTVNRVSLASKRKEARGGPSDYPSIATKGTSTLIAFQSDADNLVPNDRNGATDVYLIDRGELRPLLVSGDGGTPTGGRDPVVAAPEGGPVVAFVSSADLAPDEPGAEGDDVFVADVTDGALELASSGASAPASGESGHPELSPDGRFVVFASSTALVDDDVDEKADVYLKDLRRGTVVLVSEVSAEASVVTTHPDVSGDGRRVVFQAPAAGFHGRGGTNKGVFLVELDL